MTFIEDVLSEQASLEDIDSYRQRWDESGDEAGEYHDFLGLLWPEYAMYVEEDDVLEYAIAARRAGLNVWQYLEIHRHDSDSLARHWLLAQRYQREWAAIRP